MNNYTKTIFIAIVLIFSQQLTSAQEIKGYVYELISSNPIWNATIKNTRTNEVTKTNKDGSFKLAGVINDYFVISNTGYVTDTIFYYEQAIRRIYMNRDENLINIDEVLVSRLTDSRLALEIQKAKNEGQVAETSQTKGGLRISPSRLFGKKSIEARANLDLLVKEQNNRKVDRVFTTQLIASLTPLNEQEIPLFRERFRPTLEFIQLSSPADIRLYILDSYKEYKTN